MKKSFFLSPEKSHNFSYAFFVECQQYFSGLHDRVQRGRVGLLAGGHPVRTKHIPGDGWPKPGLRLPVPGPSQQRHRHERAKSPLRVCLHSLRIWQVSFLLNTGLVILRLSLSHFSHKILPLRLHSVNLAKPTSQVC